jgi:RNA polymerase sigma-70 factor (ECF subfamily)
MVAAPAIAGLGFALSVGKELSLAPTLTADGALARSAARGDKRAFSRLVDLHQRAVYGLCLRLLRDGEEARDASQETFVRAFAAVGTYDPGQPFAPWLLRIARNHCLDALRRRIPAGRRLELDADPADGAAGHEIPDAAAPSADDLLDRHETATTLEAAVEALPANYREVVHLFHVEQMSYRQIAATMDVPIGTVMTWLHRARARLRLSLAPAAPEGNTP